MVVARRSLRAFHAFLALAALVHGCGGRSVKVDGERGDATDQGGTAGHAGGSGRSTGGDVTGGVSTAGGVSAGGVSTSGTQGLGGSPGAAGVGAGGSPVGGAAGIAGAGAGGSGGYGWDTCPDFGRTTIDGTVYDPAGRTPLYNVAVYVPNGPPADFIEGVRCDHCADITPTPASMALTDTRGRFHLDAPSGTDVPVVVQVGRWRREVTVPLVRPCVENPYDDPELFRLPRSQSEGHLPRIAVVTGSEDSLECLLRRIGIDDSEFTNDVDSGRVTPYVGCSDGSSTGANLFSNGVAFEPASELYSTPPRLLRYDLILLGCEGTTCESEKQPYFANLARYADLGGRLMLDHLQRTWLENVADWRNAVELAPMPGTLPETFPAELDVTFPKGLAFSEWLVNVGASSRMGELPLHGAEASLRSVVPPTQSWLYTSESPADADGLGVFLMTMTTPVTAPDDQRCGRVTFTDFHAYGAMGEHSRPDVPFPDGCSPGPLSPQEAAFEFQLFDVSSCVQHDIQDPPR